MPLSDCCEETQGGTERERKRERKEGKDGVRARGRSEGVGEKEEGRRLPPPGAWPRDRESWDTLGSLPYDCMVTLRLFTKHPADLHNLSCPSKRPAPQGHRLGCPLTNAHMLALFFSQVACASTPNICSLCLYTRSIVYFSTESNRLLVKHSFFLEPFHRFHKTDHYLVGLIISNGSDIVVI